MGRTEQLPNTEDVGPATAENPKIELEIELGNHIAKMQGITFDDWVEKYAKHFGDLYKDEGEEMYKEFKKEENYDRNPASFFNKIQTKLEEKGREKQS